MLPLRMTVVEAALGCSQIRHPSMCRHQVAEDVASYSSSINLVVVQVTSYPHTISRMRSCSVNIGSSL